jgi:hypothetical protein
MRERAFNKVFCIGLNKTGTSSLNAALTNLGLRCLHYGGLQTAPAVNRALEEGRPLLSYVGEDFEAYSDISPLTANFEIADHDYPGSRFILTTRRVEDWLASRRLHVEGNVISRERGRYDGKWLEVDVEGWARLWRRHHERALSYFVDRPGDLLTIDICSGLARYEPLCAFLGLPIVEGRLPWENKTARGHQVLSRTD